MHGLQQVALRHRRDRARYFRRRPKQIVDQGVDRTFHLAPGAAGEPELDALLGLSLLADPLTDTFELLCHTLVRRDDLIERVRDLALDAKVRARHANGKVADAHRLER